MIGAAFHSEWVKMRRRRLWFGAYGALAGVVLLTTVVTIAGAPLHGGAGAVTVGQLAHPAGITQGLADSVVLLGSIALSIAAAQFGGEFTHGTLRNLLVRQPRRWVVLSGKCLAVLSFLIGALLAAAVVGTGAGFAAAAVRGVPTGAWTSVTGLVDLGRIVGDLAASVSGFAVVGMVLGVLLRSSVIAIAAGLALLLPVETIVTSSLPGAARWLPGHLLQAIAQGGTATSPFGPALVTVGAYLAALAAATVLVFLRRDVRA